MIRADISDIEKQQPVRLINHKIDSVKERRCNHQYQK